MDRSSAREILTFRMDISGLVQGVGFRPFIYLLARELDIKGQVENRNDGVLIHFNHSREGANQFKKHILQKAPLASDIEKIELRVDPFFSYDSFAIKESRDISTGITEISPDIGVCPDCLRDMKEQRHRIQYPFINCTHCGPRFSIIRALPYDRPNTTMESFVMCESCRSEYNDITNRRFHAQPVACNNCGPSYRLEDGESESESTQDIHDLLRKICNGLSHGNVYAVKGIGGFHLMCDAMKEGAISKLRAIKKRDGKPFALMFRNPEEAKHYVAIDEQEEKLLNSWQRPIVLLKKTRSISKGIADGLSTLGVMLPYMPFHHLLFEASGTPAIVLTSGNISDEPILISNQQAGKQLGPQLDGIISHNREIHNRNDDSVARVMNKAPMLLRRSRGYAPSPIRTHIRTEGVFAAGAELTASFCMGKARLAFMSQYLGDLKNYESYEFYKEAYERYSNMFRFNPELIVYDLHPDYLSTRFAKELAGNQLSVPAFGVQHHHAHIASVMLDQGLDGEVIGISFDGLGLGDDGHLWGAEVMIADYKDYKRIYQFEYMPLPGGDRVSKEPWRMAVSYLKHCFVDEFRTLPLPMLEEIPSDEISNVCRMIDRAINTPMISSCGRLFDAVAAILGINFWSTFQAEAPMRLESMADQSEKGVYLYEIENGQVSFQPLIRDLTHDLMNGVPVQKISGRFHNTVVKVILDLIHLARREFQLERVVLSGGSFQNRILTEGVVEGLRKEDIQVYVPGRIPVNDQGIALGQLAIGAARVEVL